MAVDPHDPAAVADALRGWAERRFGGEVSVVGTPIGGRRRLRLLHPPGRPDRCASSRPRGASRSWCGSSPPSTEWPSRTGRRPCRDGPRRRASPAPAVLEVLAPGDLFGLPAQVMERAPGTTMLDALTARPWRALALVRQLAGIQLALHALPLDGWPSSTDPRCWSTSGSRSRVEPPPTSATPELAAAVERASDLADAATTGPAVVCHGDFHPLNVMVDGATASVIDWTDAGLGPREADVSRTLLLFHIAAIAASSRLERRVLTRRRAPARRVATGAPTRPAPRWTMAGCARGRRSTRSTAGRRSSRCTRVASTVSRAATRAASHSRSVTSCADASRLPSREPTVGAGADRDAGHVPGRSTRA